MLKFFPSSQMGLFIGFTEREGRAMQSMALKLRKSHHEVTLRQINDEFLRAMLYSATF